MSRFLYSGVAIVVVALVFLVLERQPACNEDSVPKIADLTLDIAVHKAAIERLTTTKAELEAEVARRREHQKAAAGGAGESSDKARVRELEQRLKALEQQLQDKPHRSAGGRSLKQLVTADHPPAVPASVPRLPTKDEVLARVTATPECLHAVEKAFTKNNLNSQFSQVLSAGGCAHTQGGGVTPGCLPRLSLAPPATVHNSLPEQPTTLIPPLQPPRNPLRPPGGHTQHIQGSALASPGNVLTLSGARGYTSAFIRGVPSEPIAHPPPSPRFSGARDGSTRGRGMDGKGVGDRAATPPPPRVHQPAPCRCRLLPRPRALNGEREGLAMRRPETAGHTIPYHTPSPPHPRLKDSLPKSRKNVRTPGSTHRQTCSAFTPPPCENMCSASP